MVSKIFYFHPYLGKIPNLANIFQPGWNHQHDKLCFPQTNDLVQLFFLVSVVEMDCHTRCFVPRLWQKRRRRWYFFCFAEDGRRFKTTTLAGGVKDFEGIFSPPTMCSNGLVSPQSTDGLFCRKPWNQNPYQSVLKGPGQSPGTSSSKHEKYPSVN